MQAIVDLVNKLGIPVSVAVLVVVIAYLYKADQKRRDAQEAAAEKRRDVQDKMQRDMIEAVNGFKHSQERMADQFTASLRDIATEIRVGRPSTSVAPRRRK